VPENNFIEYNGSTLFYRRYGNGPNVLLLFHGFGQDHRAFAAWDEPLSSAYTLYSFDIFFHGRSLWPSPDTPLEKGDWKSILEIFLKSNHIGRFSLCGFSMGGKFVLATVESFPEKIQDVFLLAPDGIKTSGWYSLATYTVPFRNLFRSMIGRPDRFYAIARWVYRTGLIDKGILRFAESQMDTTEKRQRVYSSWVAFRRFTFDMTAVTGMINAHHIHVVVAVGKFDKIITAKNMSRLLDKLNSHELSILDTGHNGIIAGSVSLITPSEKN
jgi:pimeloyl-ACP methyl ester carboxylesterase